MNRVEKLTQLLQPKEYRSKIKLFCREKEYKIEKLAKVENKRYLCGVITIKEINYGK